MTKRLLILALILAAILLALGGWIVDGGRSILRPRYA
jgi:hypothetical protein